MAPSRPRHVPQRRCVRCRATRPRAALLRVARDPEGTWHLDPEARAGGRGAWLCPECARSVKERDLRRAFRADAATVIRELDAHVSERRESTEE